MRRPRRSGGHSEKIHTDLGDTWMSYGFGAQFSLTNGLNFYGMLERSSGSGIAIRWGVVSVLNGV